ncbi:MAG TPA: hypothetical protein VFX70_14870 [Mycobacteriales bacterium]|nr:hypothetical protein [Mycobacteriales bacterium]
MRVLRTFTKHYQLESRQYELFGIDLGEGVRRRALLVGVAAVLVWVGLLFAAGVALHPSTFLVWVAPPLVVTYYGTQSEASGRRSRLAGWVDAARFVTTGRRPLTGLRGDVAAERSVTVRLSTRRRMAGGVRWSAR